MIYLLLTALVGLKICITMGLSFKDTSPYSAIFIALMDFVLIIYCAVMAIKSL